VTAIRVSVYHRTDDKKYPYWLNYALPDGRRVRVPAAKTKEAAETAAAQKARELNAGECQPRFPTVQEVAEEFLESIRQSRSRKYLSTCRRTLSLFCANHGHLRILDVSPRQVEGFLSQFAHLAPATRHRRYRELKTMFNTAVKWGHIRDNPATQVRAPRVPKNPPAALSKTEVNQLLNHPASAKHRTLILTALYTGLRMGELIWLQWKDVDLGRGQIYVRNKPGHTLKSYQARTVPIPDALASTLGGSAAEPEEWVFPSPRGKRWQPENLSKRICKVFKESGLEGGLHKLRHTYASHLVMNGASLASVKELLGHASITTTMIYTHVAQEHLRTEVEKLRYEEGR